MAIEKVKMLKSVTFDTECWEVGEIYPKGTEPLHPILLQEILRKTGTVEVISHTKNIVLEKSNLTTPLSNNSLAEAQRKEKELMAIAEAERERAEQLLIDKQKLITTIEEMELNFQVLSIMVNGFVDRLDEMEKEFKRQIKNLSDVVCLLTEKADVLEKRFYSSNYCLVDHVHQDNSTKKEDASSIITSEKKVLARKTIVKRKR